MSSPKTLRVAFQGELGAFSQEAIQQLWGGDVEAVPCREFSDVAGALSRGEVDRGVLPIENTIVGSVQTAHDVIDATDEIHAIAETVVAVHHCLLGPPGATFDKVRDVFSHPVALAQCGKFFRANPRLTVHAVYDTAGAAVDVSNLADPAFAAVASRGSALRYSLDVLVPDIEDRPDNQTRFLAFARAPQPLPSGTPARTMLLLTTKDVPGALLQALAPLAHHGVNVRRIETRPTGEPWSYRFFVEFDHQVGDAAADALVKEIAALAHKVRLVGTYPRFAAGRRGSIGWTSGQVPVVD
ncbi:MAG TPA: prephenate dehydratase domain-containing protein [Gemmatimonadaceae bacterium]|nr:prephenate dehydratase domain-containing protein [Gemmatimonadaceae bacterium]